MSIIAITTTIKSKTKTKFTKTKTKTNVKKTKSKTKTKFTKTKTKMVSDPSGLSYAYHASHPRAPTSPRGSGSQLENRR